MPIKKIKVNFDKTAQNGDISLSELQGQRMLGRVQARKAKVSSECYETAATGLVGFVHLCICMRERERGSVSLCALLIIIFH